MTTESKPKIDFQEIKRSVDILQLVSGYIELKKYGNLYKGLCPLHQEKTPSFTVYPHTQSFYCYGCGEGGDCFDFVQKVDGVDIQDAAERLGGGQYRPDPSRPHTLAAPAPRQKPVISPEMIDLYTKTYAKAREMLLTGVGREVEDVRIYLSGRGFGPDDIPKTEFGAYLPEIREYVVENFPEALVKKSGLISFGAAYNYQIVLPHFNAEGEITGLTFRIVKEGADKDGRELKKYKHTPDLDKSFLYNLYKAAAEIKKAGSVIIVEGHLDVQALILNGFENVVCLGGNSINKEQIEYLVIYGASVIVFWLDSDEIGQRGCAKGIRSVMSYEKLVSFVFGSGKFKDAGEINKLSPGERNEVFKKCTDGAPGGSWLGKYMTANISPLNQHKILEEALDLIPNIKNQKEKNNFYASFRRGMKLNKEEFGKILHERGIDFPKPGAAQTSKKTTVPCSAENFYHQLNLLIQERGDIVSIEKYLCQYYSVNKDRIRGDFKEDFMHLLGLCKKLKLQDIKTCVNSKVQSSAPVSNN